MKSSSYAVILAGGRGERFWPLSTAARPKQLISLVGDRSMLAQAVERLGGLIPPERVFVITNADLVEATRAAAPELPPENVIGEPMGRDTAPAVGVATALVKARDPDAVFSILTADHIIGEIDSFQRILRMAYRLAEQEEVLITLGIPPSFPSTGYGYIEAGSALHELDTIRFYKVERFVEKPDLVTAQTYLDSGRFFWNSGMFIWSVHSIQAAFERHHPPVARLIEQLVPVAGTDRFGDALKEGFAAQEKISIDYAVMEKASNILMVRGVFPWDDVGSWPALRNHVPADEGGNVVIGDGETLESAGNIVYSRDRLTALVGVDDLIVVQAEGVTLVCHKDRAQDVKRMVQRLREQGGRESLL